MKVYCSQSSIKDGVIEVIGDDFVKSLQKLILNFAPRLISFLILSPAEKGGKKRKTRVAYFVSVSIHHNTKLINYRNPTNMTGW